jgi:hypothetical protein
VRPGLLLIVVGLLAVVGSLLLVWRSSRWSDLSVRAQPDQCQVGEYSHDWLSRSPSTGRVIFCSETWTSSRGTTLQCACEQPAASARPTSPHFVSGGVEGCSVFEEGTPRIVPCDKALRLGNGDRVTCRCGAPAP